VLKRIKQLTLRGAKAGGILSLVRESRWRHRRLLILCYHGISLDDEHEWNPALYMSADHFRRRLEMLREGRYEVLPLGRAIEQLYAGELPQRAVALTFDDGAYDFFARALPILREFEFPATVYLTTYYCGYQRPVFDTMCAYLLWKGRGRRLGLQKIVDDNASVSLADANARHRLAERISTHVREANYSAEAKDELLRHIAHELALPYDQLIDKGLLRIMSPAEVAQLPSPLVDVQLHTHRHRVPRNRAAFVNELTDNREHIRRLRGAAATIEHFCYPSGEYAPEFLPWLEQERVRSATTCDLGIASRADHALLLPRLIDTMNLSPIEFEAWLTGAARWLPTRATTTRRTASMNSSPNALHSSSLHDDLD
jgi:peptidoglycan/xylan/chitin deacetylase (PgdA/CDA1 family)